MPHLREKHLGRREPVGIGLVELGFVIAIIAVFVVAALTIFNSVKNSQDRATALQEVASIRSAVATWAGGKELRINDGGLTQAQQLGPWLPGRLGERAKGVQDLRVPGANPWNGDYEISQVTGEGAGSNSQYRFNLLIRGVPWDQAQSICRQLRDGAAPDANNDPLIQIGSVPTTGDADESACTSGGTSGNLDIGVQYRV